MLGTCQHAATRTHGLPVAPNHLRVGILAFKVAVLGLKFKSSTYSPKDPVCVSRFLSLRGAKGSVFLLKVALTWVLVLGLAVIGSKGNVKAFS